MQSSEFCLASAPLLCKQKSPNQKEQILIVNSVTGDMSIPVRLNSNQVVECRVSPAMTIFELKTSLALALQNLDIIG
jgi:hypothetical protein